MKKLILAAAAALLIQTGVMAQALTTSAMTGTSKTIKKPATMKPAATAPLSKTDTPAQLAKKPQPATLRAASTASMQATALSKPHSPVTKNGKPDMRYKANKAAAGKNSVTHKKHWHTTGKHHPHHTVKKG